MLEDIKVTLVDDDIPKEWYLEAIQVPRLGVDIETSGLDHNKDIIACVQIYVPGTGVVMVRNLNEQPPLLADLLESKRVAKIFHYGMFDLKFLMRHMQVWPENILDTKVAAKVLDPDRTLFFSQAKQKPSQSLEALVFHYFGYQMDKSIAVSNWFAPELTQEQITYAAADVVYLPSLLDKLFKELQRAGNLKLAKSAMQHIPTKAILELKNYKDVYHY